MDRTARPELVVAAAPAGVPGSSGTSATFVAYGNGDGTFGTIQRIEPGDSTWTVLDVFVRDFNGDGIPDIASLIERYGSFEETAVAHRSLFTKASRYLHTQLRVFRIVT